MNGFAPPVAPTRTSAPDATKHVNYTLGMVLGVDDFTQEFAYLLGRDQWLARDLLGYGTVSGLRVAVETDARGPRLLVEPGTALTPRGQLVRVPGRQCAYLNEWLAARDQDVSERVGSPPSLRLYVVLCYRDCLTDDVPIPGEPCRSEDETKAPSRLTDDYLLELRFAGPEQAEEEALRDFVAWLRQIELTDVPAEGTTLAAFLEAIRAAARSGSPPSPPDVMVGSPPETLRVPVADACEFLRAAFRLWVTEIRRSWSGAEASRAGAPPDEECVLLAAVDVPLVREPPNWRVLDPERVVLLEDRRPYVLSLRLLQEWALCGPRQPGGGASGQGVVDGPGGPGGPPAFVGGGPSPSATVREELGFGAPASAGSAASFARGDHTHGTPPDPIPPHRAAADAHTLGGDVTGPIGDTTVARLRRVELDSTAPTESQVLQFSGGQWRPATLPAAQPAPGPATTVDAQTAFGQAPLVGTATAFARADHNHGTPPDPMPAHRAAFDAHTLSGDVTGPIGSAIVERILGVPIATGVLVDGQVLTVRGGQWRAEAPTAGPDGAFVARPPDAGGYAIVAAGRARGDGAVAAPTYNRLEGKAIDDGQLLLTFDGYRRPDDSGRQYVVKALPVFNRDVSARLGLRSVLVAFDRYDDDGIVLSATDGAEPISRDRLAELECMVEVSEFAGRPL